MKESWHPDEGKTWHVIFNSKFKIKYKKWYISNPCWYNYLTCFLLYRHASKVKVQTDCKKPKRPVIMMRNSARQIYMNRQFKMVSIVSNIEMLSLAWRSLISLFNSTFIFHYSWYSFITYTLAFSMYQRLFSLSVYFMLCWMVSHEIFGLGQHN